MKEYWKNHKKNILWLLIGLVVILVTSFAQFMVQTSGGRVRVTDLRDAKNEGTISLNYTDAAGEKGTGDFAINGEVVSGLLFVPKDASKDNKKPGIVLTHGYLNNRELQLPFAIELARRGFVVLAVDREGHGNYDNVDNANALMATKGLYESAKYLYNLDFVDQSKIGISGHSMGGYTTAMALYTDIAPQTLTYQGKKVTASGYGIVKAGLIQGWSTFIAAGADVSVGILKAKDDEFFFKSTDSNGNATICREYLHSTGAAKFVGVSYEEGQEINIGNGVRYVNGVSVEKEDGKAVGYPFRVIYESDEIHPLNHWSIPSTNHLLDFFYGAFGTPATASYINEANQVWWVKEGFSLIGMLALLSLLIPGVSLLLTIPLFQSLTKRRTVKAAANGTLVLESVPVTKELIDSEKKPVTKWWDHLLYWLVPVVCAIFGGFSIRPFVNGWTDAWFPNTQLYPQDTTNWVSFWSAACGLFACGMVLLVYIGRLIARSVLKEQGKDYPVDNPFEVARVSSFGNALKTVVLAFLTLILFYCVVFINWGIWTVDFRFWTLAIKVFNVGKMVPTALRYGVILGVYYVLIGICNQSYRMKNLPDWATIAINAFFNVVGIFLVTIIQYGVFRTSGVLWESDMALGYIVLFPVVPILILATVISRLLYKKTGNIWLGSLINTLLWTMVTVSGTAASFAYVLG